MKVKEITDWASTDVREIVLTQDVGSTKLHLRVRKLVPQDGDSMQRTWLSKTSGIRRYHPVAPYAIESMTETVKYMMDSIDEEMDDVIQEYVHEDNGLLAVRMQ
jgi:hypothetical protein